MKTRRDFLRCTIVAAFAHAIAHAAARGPIGSDAAVLDPADPIAKRIRFRPGNYLDFPDRLAAASEGAGAWLYESAAHPGVRGIAARFTWRGLEPRRDAYDFSGVDRLFARAQKVGKPALLFIGDKSFTRGGVDIPDYVIADLDGLVTMDTSNTKSALVQRGGGGSMPRRWDPRVNARYLKLLAELGRRYDTEPHFEALLFQETHSAHFLVGPGYTTEKHLDAIRDRLRAARAALPHVQVCQYTNANFDDRTKGPAALLSPTLREIRGMLGAPDILPFQPYQMKDLHPHYETLKGIIPLCAAMQNDSFRHREPHNDKSGRSVKLDEMLDFALNRLHLNHIVWNAIARDSHGYDYDFPDDALAAIAKRPDAFARDWKFTF